MTLDTFLKENCMNLKIYRYKKTWQFDIPDWEIKGYFKDDKRLDIIGQELEEGTKDTLLEGLIEFTENLRGGVLSTYGTWDYDYVAVPKDLTFEPYIREVNNNIK